MLKNFVEAIDSQGIPVLGVVVRQHGREIARHDWEPPIRLNIYSASKSYTATAFGIAMREGLVDLDERVIDFFPESLPEDVSPEWQRLRVRHLLNMSSGMDRPYLMGETRPGMAERDWLRFCLSRPIVHEPGTHFLYNNADPYLVGRIVQKVAGTDLVHYLMPRLFEPMGIALPTWEVDPQGYTFGAGGLFLTVDDLALLGQLYLDGGVWNGRRIVDERMVEFVRGEGIATGSDRPDGAGYAGLFWKGQCHSYRADGKYNQFSIVLPDWDAVVAITAFVRGEGDVLDCVWRYIVPELA